MNITHNIPQTAGGLAVVLSGLTLAYGIGNTFYNLYLHPLARYTGRKLAAVSQVWYAYHWTSGRWSYVLRDLHKRYGDVVRIAPNELSFASVDSYQDIYGHASKSRRPFEKGPSYDWGTKYRPIVDATGQDHRAQRKVLSHAFSAKALRDQEDVVQQYVNLLTAQLGAWSSRPDGINIIEALNWITFDIIDEHAFGESFNAVETGETHPWVSFLIDTVRGMNLVNMRKRMPIMNLILPFLVPRDLGAKLAAHWAYTVAMTKKRIHDGGRATPVERQCPHHRWFRDHGYCSGRMFVPSDAQRRLPGHVTERSPQCLRHARRNHGRCDPEATLPPCLRQKSCSHLPPVAFGLQRVFHGATVDGQWVPAGALVSSQNWTISHDERYWQDPDSFKPERWLTEGLADNKDASQPFSLGPRACIGINLAYLEMRFILAKIVWQYDFELLSKELDWERGSIMYVLWQKPVINMKFHRRESAEA